MSEDTRERVTAGACLVWMLGCWAAAIYCAVVNQFGLFFGLAIASLALPILMPVMHEYPDDKLTIALGNFNRVRAERDKARKDLGGAEDLAVVWRERGQLAELERDAFKDALEHERSLNDSVVAPMRHALERIAETTDVDMGGEYVIHNQLILSAVQARLLARKALDAIRNAHSHSEPGGR